MRKAALAVAVAVLAPSPAPAQAPAPDPDLAKGKQEVREGRYEDGIATLTEVVRRLRGAADRGAQAADAYLHLGIAYAGLGQPSPARSQFVQALMRDPTVAPDPETAPPPALEAFAAARAQAANEGVLAAASRRKKGPGAKIAIAAGAAAAVGGAVALSGGETSRATTAPRIAFIPLSTSPYIQLVNALPDAGSTFSASQTVSLTLQTTSPPEPIRFFYLADALTAEGRPCLSGQAGVFGVGPGGSVIGTFALSARCPAPFTTERLDVSLQDADTREPLHRASYSGRYQVVP